MNLSEVDELQKAYYDSNLYSFSKRLLGYKDLETHTHGPICSALQDTTTRKLICVPRGCFKSSISTVSYPIWLLNQNPNRRILLDSEVYTNSKNFLREIKAQYETNAEFRRLYGDQVGPLWNESEIIVKGRTKPLKEPSIACSGIGAGKTSQHYDFIIADDLSSYLNVKNPEVAKKTIDHYRGYISLLDPGGTLVIIGTRYSHIDIIGFVIENELGIKDGDLGVLKELYK